jgi:hypothetical protein
MMLQTPCAEVLHQFRVLISRNLQLRSGGQAACDRKPISETLPAIRNAIFLRKFFMGSVSPVIESVTLRRGRWTG